MKICMGCGAPLQDKDTFCWKCGATITKKKKKAKEKGEEIRVIPIAKHRKKAVMSYYYW